MSLELFRAVQTARHHLHDGESLPRAAALAALEHGVAPEDVARLADVAHRACEVARHETQNARLAGGSAERIPNPAADGAIP